MIDYNGFTVVKTYKGLILCPQISWGTEPVVWYDLETDKINGGRPLRTSGINGWKPLNYSSFVLSDFGLSNSWN